MPLSFLTAFPREIRDQIYTYVLASPSGVVSLSPWTVDVARSLSLQMCCKQIRRECKDLIWLHNNLSLRKPTQLFEKFDSMARLKRIRRIQHVKIRLELLDRDELEWMCASLKALAGWSPAGSLKSIMLVAIKDCPRSIDEFQEALNLRAFGESVDGRLYADSTAGRKMTINTSWPSFSHWGKQSWLREMLLDASCINALLKEIHESFGGKMYIDGLLCFKDRAQVEKEFNLNPRDGEVKIILE